MWQMSKSKRRSIDQTKTWSPESESVDIQQAPTEKKINRLLLFFQRKRKPKVSAIYKFYFPFRHTFLPMQISNRFRFFVSIFAARSELRRVLFLAPSVGGF